MKRRLKRFGRWLLRLGMVGLVLALIAGGYFYDYPRVAADLPEAALAYREAGLPWTAKDLAPNPPVKPEENAAPLLREAIAAWPKTRVKNGEWQEFDSVLNAEIHGEPTAPLLPPSVRPLSLAHEAVKRPRLDFKRDWDLGAELLFPELSGIKSLARTFVVRAKVRARLGDDEGAMADLDDARRLGALIATEPGIFSVSVGATCEKIALHGSQECLALAAKEEGRLSRYRAWLERRRPVFDLCRAFRGDLYLHVADVRNFDRRGIATSPNPFFDVESFMGPRTIADSNSLRRDGFPEYQRPRAYMARLLRGATEIARRTHGLTASSDQIAAVTESMDQEWSAGVTTASAGFDPLLFPIYVQFSRTNRRLTADRALTLALCDALLQHAKTGAWPLYSNVPDPLGEGTFNVRADKDGRFRIWSVGDDGVDDGGYTSDELRKASKTGEDLVAAYPPIPRKIEKR